MKTHQLLTALVFAPAFAKAAWACEPVTFNLATVVYQGGSPDLSWKPVAGATAYAVELIARVPEGAVLEKQSFRTKALSASVPTLDASRPTKISLAVTPICGATAGATTSRTMLIAPTSDCTTVSGLSTDSKGPPRSISWTGSAAAEFEVRAFDPVSGALIANLRTRESRAAGVGESGAVVISVRPICGRYLGPPAYLFAD